MILMKVKLFTDINMIFLETYFPNDLDIDKVYCRIPFEMDNTAESIAYKRVRSIANADTNNVNWAVAIKCVTEDINTISNLIRSNKLKFPEELKEFTKTINNLFNVAIRAFDERNSTLLEDVDRIESSIDDMCAQLEVKHIDRLKVGLCTPQIGSVYLQTISNLERVADHITNVAFSIMHYRHVDGKVKK